MKIRKNLLKIVILFILLGSIVNAEYLKENGRIYFIDNKVGIKEEIKDADFKTFEIFEENYNLAKDKNSVYIGKQRLEGISPKGFKILDKDLNFVKNDENIYLLKKREDGTIFKEKTLSTNDIDISSFEYIAGSSERFYFKDSRNVYCFTVFDDVIKERVKVIIEKVDGANPKTFKFTGYNFYGKDDKNVYQGVTKLDGIDPKTFKEIDYETIKDKNGVYILNGNYKKLKVDGLDVKSFEEIDNNYFRDKNSIYYKMNENIYKLKNADLKTFKILNSADNRYTNFSKDKNNVYYKNKILDEMDVYSFERIQDNFVKDKNGIYKIEENENNKNLKIILIDSKIDFKNLKKLNGRYFWDSKNIYYFGENDFKKVDGADINSFQQTEYTNFFKDKSNIYYEGKKLEGISSDSFYYFDGIIWHETILADKNGFYKFLKNENKEKPIELIPIESNGVDLKTLKRVDSKVISSNYFKDKNGVYYMDGKKFIKINEADKDSFEVTPLGRFGKDKNNVYFEEKKMEGESPDTIREIYVD